MDYRHLGGRCPTGSDAIGSCARPETITSDPRTVGYGVFVRTIWAISSNIKGFVRVMAHMLCFRI